jgi:eukaryotic-like serine/threonine-protein kinase
MTCGIISAASPWPRGRTRFCIARRSSRRVTARLGLAAAASVVVALVAGAAIAVLQARQSARERDHALVALRRAEATNDFSSFLLAQATPSAKPISNAELLARGEALIEKRFANDPDLRVHMLLTLADRYQENQQFDARARLLERAYTEPRLIADAGLRSYAACERATQFAERGDYKQAFALLDGAMPVVAANPDAADYEAQCRVAESVAANQMNDGARAIAAGERALKLEQERRGAPGREMAPLVALANAYTAGYRYGDAQRAFARAVALLDAQGLGDTRSMAELLNNWSAMLQDAGQMLEAVPAAERAVRIASVVDTENGASLSQLSTQRADGGGQVFRRRAHARPGDCQSPPRWFTTTARQLPVLCDSVGLRRR